MGQGKLFSKKKSLLILLLSVSSRASWSLNRKIWDLNFERLLAGRERAVLAQQWADTCVDRYMAAGLSRMVVEHPWETIDRAGFSGKEFLTKKADSWNLGVPWSSDRCCFVQLWTPRALAAFTQDPSASLALGSNPNLALVLILSQWICVCLFWSVSIRNTLRAFFQKLCYMWEDLSLSTVLPIRSRVPLKIWDPFCFHSCWCKQGTVIPDLH